MTAGQVAGLGGLPDHDERGPVEVQVRAGPEGFPVRMPGSVRMGMRHASTLADIALTCLQDRVSPTSQRVLSGCGFTLREEVW